MPKKKFVSNKVGILLGIALALSIIGAINLVSVSLANENGTNDTHGGMMQMMTGVTQEETGEMLKIMDKDNNGLCDHCSMSVDACSDMMTLR